MERSWKLTDKDWNQYFILVTDKLRNATKYKNNLDLLQKSISWDRNPLGTDLTRFGSSYVLPYRMAKHMKTSNSKDHLIHTTNIAAILYTLEIEYNITNKWKSHYDMMDTLKALNVIFECPSTFHHAKLNDWSFKYKDVMDSIHWNKKLIRAGIHELVDTETGDIKDINLIWSEWYENYYVPFIWEYMKVAEPA